jgi:hypothetical protein
MRSGGVIAIATAAALAPAAAAHAQGAVNPDSITRSTTVPAGDSRSLTLRCQKGSVALNAAVTSLGAGVAVRDSIPGSDARRWTIRLVALEGAGRRDVSAELRCVSLRLSNGVRAVALRTFTERRPSLRVPAMSTRRFELRCGRGHLPTGYGLDRGRQGSAEGLPSGEVRLAAAVPTRRGWVFRLENTGGADARAGVAIRCLKRSAVGRRRGAADLVHRFSIARPRFRDTVDSGGEREVSNRCGSSAFSVATGVELDATDDITLSGTHPDGSRGGVWTFNQGSGSQAVSTYLVCLDLETRFE